MQCPPQQLSSAPSSTLLVRNTVGALLQLQVKHGAVGFSAKFDDGKQTSTSLPATETSQPPTPALSAG